MTRRDRAGDEITEQPEPDHATDCVDGWLGEDHLGRPRPCRVCKGHLDGLQQRLVRSLQRAGAA